MIRTYAAIFCIVGPWCLAACAPTAYPEYEVNVDERFSAEDQAIVESALREWEDRTERRVQFYVHVGPLPASMPSNGVYIMRTGRWGQCTDGHGLHPQWCGIMYPARGGHVECLDGEYLYSSVLHETGHVMGLQHNDTAPGAMRSNVGEPHLTAADLDQFCQVSGLCS